MFSKAYSCPNDLGRKPHLDVATWTFASALTGVWRYMDSEAAKIL